MHYRLRLPLLTWAWLLAFAALPTALRAQQLILPLPADPVRAAHVAAGATAARGEARTTALSLPFFEDFAGQPEGRPDPSRWKDGNVLVNERFSNAPPSRGVATFDGLDSLGRAYGLPTAFGPTDVLTSQAIDLSGVQPGQSTYLSFFWQTGSVADGPNAERNNRQVRLVLEFLDNTGTWRQVWYNPSVEFTGPSGRITTLTRFRQRFIAVNEARYMHAGFRFRFRSFGSFFGTRDTWNLDYLILDRNRDTTAVSYNDLALSAPLSSLLKRYTAMPARQFNAAPNPTLELNDSTFTTLNSLDTLGLGTPYTYQGDVKLLPNGAPTQFVTGSPFAPSGIKQRYTGGSLRGVPLSIPSGSGTTRVQHSIYLSLLFSPLPRTTLNDTVRRTTEFADYFAYDDGTPEVTTFVAPPPNTLPASRAMRFWLNAPDQVSKIRYYYAGTTTSVGNTLPANVTVTFNVWGVGSDGLPLPTPLASVSQTLPTSTVGGFREVTFSQPVPVDGSFFIGYTQVYNTTTLFIQFGADRNSRRQPGTIYDRSNNAWTPYPVAQTVPILRPVMTGQVTSTQSAATDAAVQVYPNPSSGLVQVQGRYTRAVVLDALGRTAWEQPAAQAGQAQLDLRRLPAGVYLLRLTLPDGAVGTKRLVLQP